ncbi:MAG: DUF4136 domain-containing protein [Bacteroidota bacterium]
MKRLRHIVLATLALVFLASCSSVKVIADYDKEANFKSYKTYAFYKTGIDKAEVSDLDKKRILKAIDTEMSARGFVKSRQPDVLVSIFTKEREEVNVYNNNNFGFGWGAFGWGGFGFNRFGFYNPWLFGPGFGGGFGPNVTTRTEGSLYIDVIDAKNRELVWQGRGVGTLNNIKNIERKEKRIRQFVSEIFEKYPPISQLASN